MPWHTNLLRKRRWPVLEGTGQRSAPSNAGSKHFALVEHHSAYQRYYRYVQLSSAPIASTMECSAPLII